MAVKTWNTKSKTSTIMNVEASVFVALYHLVECTFVFGLFVSIEWENCIA